MREKDKKKKNQKTNWAQTLYITFSKVFNAVIYRGNTVRAKQLLKAMDNNSFLVHLAETKISCSIEREMEMKINNL